MDFVKRGNAIVPFEEGRRVSGQLDGPVVKFPNRIEDRMVVRVENEAFEF